MVFVLNAQSAHTHIVLSANRGTFQLGAINATESVTGVAIVETYASTAWVSASIPVAAVKLGGCFIINKPVGTSFLVLTHLRRFRMWWYNSISHLGFILANRSNYNTYDNKHTSDNVI